MDILTEIIETADYMIEQLRDAEFFEENLFCDPFKLRREFEMQMQRNWEQLEDMYLSDEQFVDIIRKVSEEGINKTFGEMVMDNVLNIDSIDSNGELIYKLNPEIDIDDYLQSKE